MSNATLQLGGGNFAVKDGKLLGYATDPKTSVFVSREFDFSRGSNLAATRVDANGLIEKGRENTFTYSDMTSGISLDGITRTTGYADPFGGNNAIKITENTSFSNHRWYKLSATLTGVYTASFYAKYDTRKYVRVFTANQNATIDYNLIDGTIDYSSSNIDSTMVSVGGGWYRCSVSVNGNSSNWIGVYLLNDSRSNNYTGDGTSSALLYGFQLEAGLVATDYIETGATTVQAGILENMPRIDYTNSSSPALLLEPQRTNQVLNSEYRQGSDAVDFRITTTSNAAISPEGLQNATLFTENTDTDTHFHSIGSISWNASTIYTISAYVKRNGRDLSLRVGNTAVIDFTTTYDLINGVVLSSNASSSSIKDVGNGWWRVTATATATLSSGTNVLPFLYNNILTYTGDGTSGIYVYGFQVEAGSYPTSYIPTYGTAVTRGADRCYFQSSDVHSDNSGTMFFEVGDYNTATAPNGFRKIITANAVSASNLDNIIYFEEYEGKNSVLLRKGGSTLLQTTPSYQDLRNSKIAIKWSDEGAKIFINGVLNKSYTGDASLNLQYFGHATSYSEDVSSTIAMKQRVHFRTALTDSDCIALTTL